MLSGSIVALVTPMGGDDAIDWEALENLIELHCASGTSGIVAVGTTGESATLDFDEHCEVIGFIVAKAKQRIKVIGGTGANSTHEATELTHRATELGVDACLLVTPYYNKPTQEGLYLHYCAIAEAVDIPQILYNVPGRTACDILPSTVQRLAQVPGIIGIKEATGSISRAKELLSFCDDQFTLYCGDDAIACEMMLLGASGNISVTANVAPALMAQLCAYARSGERAKAIALNNRLEALNKALFIEANPIGVKWAMAYMNKIQAGIRLPLTPLSERYHQQMRDAMVQAGVI